MASQANAINKELAKFVENLVKKVAVNATAQIAEDTPIDTGWARVNWVPLIGERFSGLAGTREAAENGTLDQGTQASGIAQVASAYKLPTKIFITNNVSYIINLNDGTSSQAPSGFVQIAIGKTIRDISRQ